jgi:hypothetical protein
MKNKKKRRRREVHVIGNNIPKASYFFPSSSPTCISISLRPSYRHSIQNSNFPSPLLPEFPFQQGLRIQAETVGLLSILSNGYPGAIHPGIEQPRREADHIPPSSDEVKNCEAIPAVPHVLITHYLNSV